MKSLVTSVSSSGGCLSVSSKLSRLGRYNHLYLSQGLNVVTTSPWLEMDSQSFFPQTHFKAKHWLETSPTRTMLWGPVSDNNDWAEFKAIIPILHGWRNLFGATSLQAHSYGVAVSLHGSLNKYLKLPYSGKIKVAAAGVTGHYSFYHCSYPEEAP